jgi:hypothetical protein
MLGLTLKKREFIRQIGMQLTLADHSTQTGYQAWVFLECQQQGFTGSSRQ